jgi:hypothetical protein
MDAADLKAFDDDAALTGEALWPDEITISGQTYPARVVDPRLTGELMDGGEDYAAELVVRLRKSIHATRPALQTRLTRGGSKWRVRLVVSNDCDATWTLRCEPDN